jgi:hypothetical protein
MSDDFRALQRSFVGRGGSKMTHENCTADPVTNLPDFFEFLVRSNERKKALLTLDYRTRARAEEARDAMAKGLFGATVTPLRQ